MANKYPALKDLPLWPHQKEAVGIARSYIRRYWKDPQLGSALIQMPTGGGKSGVIAILARCTRNVGLTLVLTPRRSLRDQLNRDIGGRFFEHIGYPVNDLPKEIQKVIKGADLRLNIPSDDQVVVMTIQMLVQLDDNRGDLFTRIKDETSLLIVDEGHYEPAFEWSKTIRKIRAPKVIFTATPYRNDFKVFDINPEHSFVLSLSSATRDKYLRSVEFIPREHTTDPSVFAEDIIGFYDETFPSPTGDPPRVIIRCDASASIRQLADELKNRGKSVIGIHEAFKGVGGETWERKQVPEPNDESAVFWIHQLKLLEGIDDSRFQMLAMFEKLRTARSLVQQVGRIIRNPQQVVGAKGYVLDHWHGHHKDLWDTFLSYDQMVKEHGKMVFEVSTGEGILPKLIELQPKIAYVEGRFRTKFNFEGIDPSRDIQVPLRTNLIEKLSDFNIDAATEFLIRGYREEDRVVEQYSLSDNTRLILSIRCSNSPFLRYHSFIEADLNITILREFQNYIALYDSSGARLIGEKELGLGHSHDVEDLKKLFHPGADCKLISVSLNNSNLGTSSIRSKTITASSIADTIPGFDDYAHICTIAEGYSRDEAGSVQGAGKARRYVGFSRGRVTQSTAGLVQLPDYLAWLDRLENILNGPASNLAILTRYALQSDVPSQADPRSILLDLEEARDSYYFRGESQEPVEIEDACYEVEDGAFIISANGQSVRAKVSFLSERGKYKIESADLETMYARKEGESIPSSLVKYLNNTQSFRILPQDFSLVYVRGQFYHPAMKIGSEFDPETYALGNCFIADNTIGLCASEKGSSSYYTNHDDNWDPESLFGIISRCGAGTGIAKAQFGNPDIIVCDDMGTEIADFLLCKTDRPPRIIFVHAKASGPPPKCSTSGLHEVCAQAVKNLGYLAMFNDQKPSKLGSWDADWKTTIENSPAIVLKRIHKGSGNASEIWGQLRATINNPMVDKEVWLFTGNLISKEHFETELGKASPPAHIVQAAYLLHATMSDVASVGAKLKIFCAL